MLFSICLTCLAFELYSLNDQTVLVLHMESKVLGTFITEWDEGKRVCNKLLSTKESAERYAGYLKELAVELGFDGWLVYSSS